jgi:hypothetical protein
MKINNKKKFIKKTNTNKTKNKISFKQYKYKTFIKINKYMKKRLKKNNKSY